MTSAKEMLELKACPFCGSLSTVLGDYRVGSATFDEVIDTILAVLAAQADAVPTGPMREAVAILKWMREPDCAEEFSLADLTEWINRRPVAAMCRTVDALTHPARAAQRNEPDASQDVINE